MIREIKGNLLETTRGIIAHRYILLQVRAKQLFVPFFYDSPLSVTEMRSWFV